MPGDPQGSRVGMVQPCSRGGLRLSFWGTTGPGGIFPEKISPPHSPHLTKLSPNPKGPRNQTTRAEAWGFSHRGSVLEETFRLAHLGPAESCPLCPRLGSKSRGDKGQARLGVLAWGQPCPALCPAGLGAT